MSSLKRANKNQKYVYICRKNKLTFAENVHLLDQTCKAPLSFLEVESDMLNKDLSKNEREAIEMRKKLIHEATVLSFLCNAPLRLKSKGSIPLSGRPIKLRREI